jgi:hypothetical protein
MPGVSPLTLSLLMLGAIVLTLGGIAQVRKPTERKRGVLMLIAALVLFANALLWGLPL